MVGARVSFLDLSTNANFIELTDNEGTPLPNPLFTGSDGRLRLENGNGAPAVPCIADGLSYKVVVARKTGVEPIFMGGILQNPEELYENPFIAFVVTAMGGSGAGSNTSVVLSPLIKSPYKTCGAVQPSASGALRIFWHPFSSPRPSVYGALGRNSPVSTFCPPFRVLDC